MYYNDINLSKILRSANRRSADFDPIDCHGTVHSRLTIFLKKGILANIRQPGNTCATVKKMLKYIPLLEDNVHFSPIKEGGVLHCRQNGPSLSPGKDAKQHLIKGKQGCYKKIM